MRVNFPLCGIHSFGSRSTTPGAYCPTFTVDDAKLTVSFLSPEAGRAGIGGVGVAVAAGVGVGVGIPAGAEADATGAGGRVGTGLTDDDPVAGWVVGAPGMPGGKPGGTVEQAAMARTTDAPTNPVGLMWFIPFSFLEKGRLFKP